MSTTGVVGKQNVASEYELTEQKKIKTSMKDLWPGL